jgi:hypothetical protein
MPVDSIRLEKERQSPAFSDGALLLFRLASPAGELPQQCRLASGKPGGVASLTICFQVV